MHKTLFRYGYLSPVDIAAFPDSVNALEGVCGDVRTPDKLIDQVNDTSDGRHMWLAPILPGLVGVEPGVCDLRMPSLGVKVVLKHQPRAGGESRAARRAGSAPPVPHRAHWYVKMCL